MKKTISPANVACRWLVGLAFVALLNGCATGVTDRNSCPAISQAPALKLPERGCAQCLRRGAQSGAPITLF